MVKNVSSSPSRSTLPASESSQTRPSEEQTQAQTSTQPRPSRRNTSGSVPRNARLEGPSRHASLTRSSVHEQAMVRLVQQSTGGPEPARPVAQALLQALDGAGLRRLPGNTASDTVHKYGARVELPDGRKGALVVVAVPSSDQQMELSRLEFRDDASPEPQNRVKISLAATSTVASTVSSTPAASNASAATAASAATLPQFSMRTRGAIDDIVDALTSWDRNEARQAIEDRLRRASGKAEQWSLVCDLKAQLTGIRKAQRLAVITGWAANDPAQSSTSSTRTTTTPVSNTTASTVASTSAASTSAPGPGTLPPPTQLPISARVRGVIDGVLDGLLSWDRGAARQVIEGRMHSCASEGEQWRLITNLSTRLTGPQSERPDKINDWAATATEQSIAAALDTRSPLAKRIDAQIEQAMRTPGFAAAINDIARLFTLQERNEIALLKWGERSNSFRSPLYRRVFADPRPPLEAVQELRQKLADAPSDQRKQVLFDWNKHLPNTERQ